MDNIDDYFDDDLVLDEQTLAILDREEQKYLSQVQQQPRPPFPAVTKRLKTRDGWSPGTGSQTREDELDDLPEISVTADGNYGFTDSTTLFTSSSQTLENQRNAPQARKPNQNATTAPPLQPPISFSRSNPQPTHVLPVPISKPPPLQPRNTRQTLATPSRQNGVTEQPILQKQLANLQAQLVELKAENQKIQDALKTATDLRYTKEGEVSILRKTMEKVSLAAYVTFRLLMSPRRRKPMSPS